MGVDRLVLGLVGCVVAALLISPAAAASDLFSDRAVVDVRLAVNRRGESLVTYRRADGRPRRVLVWGAVDALPPTPGEPQVRFRFDYGGGWGKYRRSTYWRTFGNSCRPYAGPPLALAVAACTAPDGSYWALQSWPRNLPHRGFAAWQPWQEAPELRISHWTGEIAKLEAYADWAFGGQAHGLFGRLTYRGGPVYGFTATRNGIPTDGYGRNLYIDTLDSAYGAGWKRETSVLFRRPSGAFCYSFWPTRDVALPGYPDNLRPAGKGARYKITVVGPGVTPDVVWEGAGLPDYDPGKEEHVAHELSMNALLDQISAPDRFCPSQH